ncbi:hypothetical protein COCNU_12G003880 [Cocos nucifera]|uniref:Uncharacterized protein n=1 Tax=Cocos nucifera TaxID=13894 RepID=A0A8K0NB45_COCNU|nr:hypothetical protein COCNU_12G003880 [Cocos nucifera]
MARMLLFCLVSLDLVTNLVMARPMPLEARVTLEIGSHGEAHAPSGGVTPHGEWKIASGPEQHMKHHHRSFDKSVAGAHVILGGLVVAVLAAAVAYIWVTRKRTSSNKS